MSSKSDYDTVANAVVAIPFNPTTYRAEAELVCKEHGWEYNELIGAVAQLIANKIREASHGTKV
jgi:hypothetical protein